MSRKGRPTKGLRACSVLITGPEILLDAVRRAARIEGISTTEWWRRAARARLLEGAKTPEVGVKTL
jgi:hypothetical protein